MRPEDLPKCKCAPHDPTASAGEYMIWLEKENKRLAERIERVIGILRPFCSEQCERHPARFACTMRNAIADASSVATSGVTAVEAITEAAEAAPKGEIRW